MPLLTLNNGVALGQIFGSVVFDRTFVSSVVATWNLRDLTVAEGPIICGLAHSDYSSAEIEGWLENLGGWNEGNLVSQEVAKRKIKIVGTMHSVVTTFEINLNEGQEIHTKLNWVLMEGQSVQQWAFNRGGANLTTGAIQLIVGHANLWPSG